MDSRRFAPVVALAALAGCVSPPAYEKADDALRALAPKERTFEAAKLCLLFTDNTVKSFDHANEVYAALGDRIGRSSRGDIHPKKLNGDLNQLFNSRFRETVRVDRLDEASRHGCDLTLALDLRLVIGMGAGQEVSADVTGSVLDANRRRIDTLGGSGKARVSFPASDVGSQFNAAWIAALGTFGGNLDKSQKVVEVVAALSRPASAGPVSRLPVVGLPAGGAGAYGNYHALVIGNDKYRAVTPLNTAVHDARTVAGMLQSEYGFRVTLLVDATRNQMLDAFDEFRRTLTEIDNLLIYYAGHGHLDADSDRGFWLPVDAEPNRRANWLSNSDLADFARASRAKHILVVADSCYAGTLTRSLSVQMTALEDLSRLAQKRARTALVSGGLEPVEDSGGGQHSVFAKAFLDVLRANNGAVDMSQIFSAMRRQVLLAAQQTPQYGDIRQTGHDGGDFIFVRRSQTPR